MASSIQIPNGDTLHSVAEFPVYCANILLKSLHMYPTRSTRLAIYAMPEIRRIIRAYFHMINNRLYWNMTDYVGIQKDIEGHRRTAKDNGNKFVKNNFDNLENFTSSYLFSQRVFSLLLQFSSFLQSVYT